MRAELSALVLRVQPPSSARTAAGDGPWAAVARVAQRLEEEAEAMPVTQTVAASMRCIPGKRGPARRSADQG
jgi:hypothetical protein